MFNAKCQINAIFVVCIMNRSAVDLMAEFNENLLGFEMLMGN